MSQIVGSENGYPIINKEREVPLPPPVEDKSPVDIKVKAPPVKVKTVWYKSLPGIIGLSALLIILIFGAGWFGGKYYQKGQDKTSSNSYQVLDGSSSSSPVSCNTSYCTNQATACASNTSCNTVTTTNPDVSPGTCKANVCALGP